MLKGAKMGKFFLFAWSVIWLSSAQAGPLLPEAQMVSVCSADVRFEGEAQRSGVSVSAAAYSTGAIRLQEFRDPRNNAIIIANATLGGMWKWVDNGASLSATIQASYDAAMMGLQSACTQIDIATGNKGKCQFINESASCWRVAAAPQEVGFPGTENSLVRLILSR